MTNGVIPRPVVKHRCRRCKVTQEDVDQNRVIVSSIGTAHLVARDDRSVCGLDATNMKWWWPV